MALAAVVLILLALCNGFSTAQKLGTDLWGAQAGQSRPSVIQSIFSPGFTSLGEAHCERKAKLMMASTWPFFRGNNPLYWHDMYTQRAVEKSTFFNPEAFIWLQGDLHIGNMGTYDDSDGEIVFGLNDFDESVQENYLYDLYRLATSFALVGRDQGLSDSEIQDIVETLGENYATRLGDFVGNNKEDKAQWTKDDADDAIKAVLKKVSKDTAAGSRKKMLDEWTVIKDGKRTFRFPYEDLEKLPSDKYDSLMKDLPAHLDHYLKSMIGSLADKPKYFTVKDIAKRLNAGVGSAGVDRYYVLIEGATKDVDDDRLLDMKLQGFPSCKIPGRAFPPVHVKGEDYAGEKDQAARTIAGYRALVYKADQHLGHLKIRDHVYSVRERSPFKKSLKTEQVELTAESLTSWATQYGQILAASHARADGAGSERFETAAYSSITEADKCKPDCGKKCQIKCFKRELASFALAYGTQVEGDYKAFVASCNSGKICTGMSVVADATVGSDKTEL